MTDPVRIEVATSPISAWSFGGPEAAPLVIALADFTANGRWFADLADRGIDQVRFAAPDLRGRGDSHTAAAVTSLRTHAADVLALADTLGADGFTLVGHGTGAVAALVTALAHPRRVQSLVLLDGPPIVHSNDAEGWIAAATAVDPGAARIGQTYPDRTTALVAGVESGRLPRSGLSRALRRAVDAEIMASGFAWRARLGATALEREWSLLRAWTPEPLPAIPLVECRAEHGHRDDQAPLDVHHLSDETTFLDTTHTGLLFEHAALEVIATQIIQSSAVPPG